MEVEEVPLNESTSSSLIDSTVNAAFKTKFSPKAIIKTQKFFWSVNFLVMTDCLITSTYAHLTISDTDTACASKKPKEYLIIKTVLMSFYVIEASLLITGKGYKKAMKDRAFLVDFLILLVSIAEIINAWVTDCFVGLSVVRVFSLIKILKLTRVWTHLNSIIRSFLESIKGVSGIVTLLFVVLCNYALLGNQLFGKPNDTSSQVGSFNTFGSSMLVTFVLLTGDNWTTFMSDNFKESADSLTKLLAITYFISFVLFGNFILMNIFLGIIVDNLTSDFEENESEDEEEKKERRMKKVSKKVGILGKVYLAQAAEDASKAEINGDNGQLSRLADLTKLTKDQNKGSRIEMGLRKMIKPIKDVISEAGLPSTRSAGVQFRTVPRERNYHTESPEYDENSLPARARAISVLADPDIAHPIPKHKALFLFSQKNKFREKIFCLVTHGNFTLVVCTLILISSIAMAFSDPLERDYERVLMMKLLDYIFTGKHILVLSKQVLSEDRSSLQRCS